jgi:hypothetical protein
MNTIKIVLNRAVFIAEFVITAVKAKQIFMCCFLMVTHGTRHHHALVSQNTFCDGSFHPPSF